MNNQEPIRVLIAEDDYVVGKTTAALLKKMGYTIVGQALDGLEAVEMTQSLRPDVVLMDIKMPIMDGIEATQHIYETCPTPVVALTAYDTPEVTERVIAAGVGAYLTKPASAQEMERAINVTIARFDDMVKLRRLNTELQAEITERKRAEEDIRQRNRELAALNTITAAMMQSALNLDEVLQRTADGIVKGLGCNTAFIFLLDEEEEVFRGGAVSTKAKTLKRMDALLGFPLLQLKIPARSDFNEAMSNLLAGRATIRHDFYELVRPLLSRRVASTMQRFLDSRTFFTIPLLAKGKTVGGIVASTPEELGEADAEKLMTFANQAAIAIENARLYQETQQRALEQETLREAALALTTALDRNKVIERILAQLQQVVPYDTASVQLFRENRMVLVGGRGFPNLPDLLGISFPSDGDNPNSEVIRTRAPFIVKNAPAAYEGFHKGPHRQTAIHSWLGVPMLISEQLVGMIALDKREPEFYTQEHARLAEAFAAQAAVAIENARLFEETRRRALQLQTIEEIGRRVSAILDPDELLPYVARAIQRSFGYYHVDIFLADTATGYAVFKASSDPARTKAWKEQGLRFKIGEEGIIGWVAHTGEHLLANDVSQEPRYLPDDLLPETKSELVVPLKVGERVVGVLDVASNEPNAFAEDDLFVLQTLSNQIAIAIENARLFQETEERRVYLEGVLGAAPDAIVTLDAHHRIAEWNEGAERLFGYSREEAIGQNLDHLVTSPDVFEEAVEFTQVVMSGMDLPPVETVRFRKDGSPVDVILAGSPILVEDELIGTVAVYTDITARVRMEETLRALALIDDLTNLYNRRGFLTLGRQQLKAADRAERRMLLLFADFNGLKQINDAFGHSEGDRALIETADVFRETFRESDIIARIGGDEFVVLAIETNGSPAEVLATRLQEKLETCNAREGRRYKLSLSVGLARYDPERPCSLDELLARADRAMYEKKGRLT